jgi:hypothetical protein
LKFGYEDLWQWPFFIRVRQCGYKPDVSENRVLALKLSTLRADNKNCNKQNPIFFSSGAEFWDLVGFVLPAAKT